MAIEQEKQGVFWIPGTADSLLLLPGVELTSGTRRMDRDRMLIVACEIPIIVRRILFDRRERDHTVKVPEDLDSNELTVLKRLGVSVKSVDFQRQRDILNGQQWHLAGVPHFPVLDRTLRRLPDGLTQASLLDLFTNPNELNSL